MDLKNILELHKKWLNNEQGGERANLNRTDLSWANLSGANLSWADLSRTNLSWANLSWANLSGANLSWADLSRTNLSGVNLSRADLSRTNLTGANLSGANISGANLDTRFIVISCIGSRKDSTVYSFAEDIVWCGCFKGTLEEFEKAVQETHANNAQYLKEYTGAIQYIRSLI